jgi:hypothetical protein
MSQEAISYVYIFFEKRLFKLVSYGRLPEGVVYSPRTYVQSGEGLEVF